MAASPKAERFVAKKLINNPEDVVDEAIEGLLLQYPTKLRRLGGLNVLLRADYKELKESGKVALLSGGGAGHEPAHVGFIGDGMLTGVVVGGVFASPSVASVLAAIRAVTGPAGTLLIVKNYTGDRLNFGMAREQALAEGLRVDMVFVADDCALPKTKGITGRRGVAGGVLVHKVAGAAAADGLPLSDVKAEAVAVAGAIGTLGLALTTCTIPGQVPSGRLAGDLIEVGMGIHGESGMERIKLQPADPLVDRMINAIVADELHGGHGYLPLTPGEAVVVLVNNLGGSPPIELSIAARRAVTFLENRFKVVVERVYVGPFMTSLEMAGCSITIARVDPARLARLDAHTDAPGWLPAGPRPHPGSSPHELSDPVPAAGPIRRASSEKLGGAAPLPLPPEDLQKYIKVIRAAAGAITLARDRLNELDSYSGDGDCGTTLERGAREVQIVVYGGGPVEGAAGLVQRVAEAVGRAMGGTSGALLEIFFRAMARWLREEVPKGGAPTQSQWADALDKGVKALEFYGGAREGYRTMIDALRPAVDGLREGGLDGMALGAREGADRTQEMEAKAGRANYVPFDRMRGHQDPGAEAAALAFAAIKEALEAF